MVGNFISEFYSRWLKFGGLRYLVISLTETQSKDILLYTVRSSSLQSSLCYPMMSFLGIMVIVEPSHVWIDRKSVV